MLRIRSVSGEVETIELASFLESRAEGRDPVRELKRHLQILCGQPRFRQRLAFLDDGALANENDAHILRAGEAQLVILSFSSASENLLQEMARHQPWKEQISETSPVADRIRTGPPGGGAPPAGG